MEEWRTLEKQYRDEFGDSRYAAHRRIASKYGTSPSTVYHYLQYGHNRQLQARSPSASPKHAPDYLRHLAFGTSFRTYPERYIVPLFQSADEAIPLDELSTRIYQAYRYKPHLKTIERMTRTDGPTNGAILQSLDIMGTKLYRLVEGLYAKLRSSAKKE